MSFSVIALGWMVGWARGYTLVLCGMGLVYSRYDYLDSFLTHDLYLPSTSNIITIYSAKLNSFNFYPCPLHYYTDLFGSSLALPPSLLIVVFAPPVAHPMIILLSGKYIV